MAAVEEAEFDREWEPDPGAVVREGDALGGVSDEPASHVFVVSQV